MKAMNRTFLKSFLSLAVIFSLCLLPIFGETEENTPINWYFKKNDLHKQPELDKNMAFISDYNGYYVGSDKEKIIYLTFDAGYENGNIKKILDVLGKHQAKGSFFILENLIQRNPEIVLRMVEEGHLVCNHTAKHPDMTKITDEKTFDKQLEALENAYKALTNEEIGHFYRPPEGRFSKQNLKFASNLGYKTIFWSYAYADWDNDRQPDPEKSLKQILDHAHNGMILLLHPTSDTNAKILERLLTALENEGYRFETLEALP